MPIATTRLFIAALAIYGMLRAMESWFPFSSGIGTSVLPFWRRSSTTLCSISGLNTPVQAARWCWEIPRRSLFWSSSSPTPLLEEPMFWRPFWPSSGSFVQFSAISKAAGNRSWGYDENWGRSQLGCVPDRQQPGHARVKIDGRASEFPVWCVPVLGCNSASAIRIFPADTIRQRFGVFGFAGRFSDCAGLLTLVRGRRASVDVDRAPFVRHLGGVHLRQFGNFSGGTDHPNGCDWAGLIVFAVFLTTRKNQATAKMRFPVAPPAPQQVDVHGHRHDAQGNHPKPQNKMETEDACDDQQKSRDKPQPPRNIAADPGEGGAQAVLDGPSTPLVGWVCHPSRASSSSIIPEIIDRPLSQNFGSLASRPNGASSSLWCLEPPARSISKYFSSNPSAPLS